MIKNYLRATALVAAFSAMFAVSPATASAENPSTSSEVDPVTVWVVNDHGTSLKVYVVGADGREQHVAFVRRGIETVSISAELFEDGPLRVKVVAVGQEPGVGVQSEQVGVKTQLLTRDAMDELKLYVSKDIPASTVELAGN
jgi:hypothetical protein